MSQAESLLNSTAYGNSSLYTTNSALEEHIVIDNNRFITVPEALKRIAVQYDHNVETVTFDCPRYWDTHDLSTMYIYINYLRSDRIRGQYLAKNITVDESNSNMIHFDWTIGSEISFAKGSLSFLVCAVETDSEGNEQHHWNSEINDEMYISDGLECSEAIINEHPDIITDLLTRMDNILAADSPILDTTLSQSGFAADAKMVGDAINAERTERQNSDDEIKFILNKKPYYFNNVTNMKVADLNTGDYVITGGYYTGNDGGGATYLIREKTSDDVEDNGLIHFLQNDLVAELIVEGKINVKKLGVKGNDESVDNGEILNNIIPNLPIGITLIFPLDYYYFKTSINSVRYLNYEGQYNYDYASVSNIPSLIFENCNGFIECDKNKFKNLIIQSTLTENDERQGYGIHNAESCNGSYIEHCTIFNWDVGVHGNSHAMFINKCNIHHNNHGVAGLVDARVINNTINSNFKHGVNLFPSCNDNIISNNKVEWNGESGIYSYSSEHNMITNNICDRNGIDGIHVSTCNYCNVTGNLLRRNGITSTGNKNTQILVLNSNNISLSGNITKTGYTQDYEQGDIVPLHGITIENCNNIYSAGNDWKGGTESDIVKISSTENIFMFDSGYNAQEHLEGIAKSYSLPVGESTIEVDGNMAIGSMPTCDKFMIYGRDNNYWSYVYQEILLSNFRLSNKDSSTEAKCNISDITEKVKITNITFNRDTGKYAITINNSDSIVFHLYFKPIYI